MIDYKIIEACECCIKCGDKVLLQHRSTLNKHYSGFYSFPGGSLDLYEDPVLGVIREVKEETGIILDAEKLKLTVSEFNYHDDENELWVISTFTTVFDQLPITVNSKEGNVEWVEIEKAMELNLVPQTKHYFEQAVNPSGKILYMITSFTGDRISKILSEKYI